MTPNSKNKSGRLFEKARRIIPGGVNSPVRAWKDVGGNPVFIHKGAGSKIFDADGRSYIDYVMSYGPIILGHAHPKVVSAVKEAASKGTTFGSCTKLEVEMAETICSTFSGIEKVRMVNSGTEAVMGALRLARGFTGKKKAIKFDGCYHGHCDSMLVKAGSGLAGKPASSGVSETVARETISLPYNNLEEAEKTLKKEEDVACVIVEPVAGNMGVVLPQEGFLAGLREATADNDVLLIFDEVITGFRLCYGGAQDYFRVKPDVTCLGKIIGGGLPAGAFGGRGDIMDHLAPEGGVYQAGTFSGNPVCLAAGLATLKVLRQRGVYAGLRENSGVLREGILNALQKRGIAARINAVESMLSVFFTGGSVVDYASARRANPEAYGRFFKAMLSRGVLIPPSPHESWFLSAAHSRRDVEATLRCVEDALAPL